MITLGKKMGPLYLLLLSVSLGADATAVSIPCGALEGGSRYGKGVAVAATFGFFQGGMALVGWSIGRYSLSHMEPFDKWIAFVLLTGIGIHMILDGAKSRKEGKECRVLTLKSVLGLGFATSIDALVAGGSLGLIGFGILFPVVLISLVTFFMSLTAFLIGSKIGENFSWEIAIGGGIILVLLGLRILLNGSV